MPSDCDPKLELLLLRALSDESVRSDLGVVGDNALHCRTDALSSGSWKVLAP